MIKNYNRVIALRSRKLIMTLFSLASIGIMSFERFSDLNSNLKFQGVVDSFGTGGPGGQMVPTQWGRWTGNWVFGGRSNSSQQTFLTTTRSDNLPAESPTFENLPSILSFITSIVLDLTSRYRTIY